MIDASLQNYYEVLGVSQNASRRDLKEAFHRLALIYHPDVANNSEDTVSFFKIINNAYTVLTDAHKRKSYDDYLAKSVVFTKRTPTKTRKPHNPIGPSIYSPTDALEVALGYLNYMLWEIEDFIISPHAPGHGIFSERSIAVSLLLLLDRKVLSPAGFPDYFYTARQVDSPGEMNIEQPQNTHGHKPYANDEDYFYNIRKRTNELMRKSKLLNPTDILPGSDCSLIDEILRIYNTMLESIHEYPRI